MPANMHKKVRAKKTTTRKTTHGSTVSAVARATPGGKGKGATVSAVARKKK